MKMRKKVLDEECERNEREIEIESRGCWPCPLLSSCLPAHTGCCCCCCCCWCWCCCRCYVSLKTLLRFHFFPSRSPAISLREQASESSRLDAAPPPPLPFQKRLQKAPPRCFKSAFCKSSAVSKHFGVCACCCRRRRRSSCRGRTLPVRRRVEVARRFAAGSRQ